MTTSFAPPPWVDDSLRPGCALCKEPFSIFSRRHHCRLCGDVYCSKCSNFTAIIPFLHNNLRPVRLCGVCHSQCILNQVDRRSYHLSIDTQKNMQAAIEAFQRLDPNKIENGTSTTSSSGNRTKSRSGFGVSKLDEQSPSFHPKIMTTEIDLWWMGQRKITSSCTWGIKKDLKNIPLAASLFMEISFQRPLKTIGMCHIDVEELANSGGQLQRFPVSRLRKRSHNKELLGHVLIAPINTTPRTNSSKTSYGNNSNINGSGENDHEKDLSSQSFSKSSWSSSLRGLIIDFFLYSTLLLIMFELIPKYILNKSMIIDVHIHSFVNKLTCTSIHSPSCRDATTLFQRWIKMIPLWSRNETFSNVDVFAYSSYSNGNSVKTPSSNIMMIVLLFIGLALRLIVNITKCFSCDNSTKTKNTDTVSPTISISSETSEKNFSKNTLTKNQNKFSALSKLSFIPIGFVRHVSSPKKIHSTEEKTDENDENDESDNIYNNNEEEKDESNSISTSTSNNKVPTSIRKAVDQAVKSFLNDCSNEKGWIYRGKVNGVDQYTGKRVVYPAAKGVGIIHAPTKVVFDVLRTKQGNSDPLGSFGQQIYHHEKQQQQQNILLKSWGSSGKKEENTDNIFYLKPSKRYLLQKYDEHTRIEQVEYRMLQKETNEWCTVVRPREFVSINHWRVLSKSDRTVIILNFGTTFMDKILEEQANENDQKLASVRGECYGGWMLHPTNDGKSTIVTRLTVLDMKMFTPSLELNIMNGIPYEIYKLRQVVLNYLNNPKQKRINDTNENNDDADEMYVQNKYVKKNQNKKKHSNRGNNDSILHLLPSDKDLQLSINNNIKNFMYTCQNNNQWDFYLEESNVKLYRKKIPHSIYAEAKGVGILKYPPTVCMAMLAKAGKVSPASPNSYANILMPEKTEQYRIIDLSKDQNGQTTLDYLLFRGIQFVVSQRDFVNVTHWRVLDDGTIVLCVTTANETLQKMHCPVKPNRVRADTMMGGWLFEPLKNGKHCRVSFIICLDLKGSIPGWIIKEVTKTQPLAIARLGQMIDDDIRNTGCSNRTEYIQQIMKNGELKNAAPKSDSCSSGSSGGGGGGSSDKTKCNQETKEKIEYDLVMEKIDTMIEKAVFLSRDDSPQWTLMFDDKGVHAEILEDGGPLVTVRGTLNMPYPPYAIIKLINACNDMSDPRSFRKAPSMKSTKLLKVYNDRTALRYLEYKGLAFVSGRDFCNIHHWRPVGEEIHAVAYAEERLDLAPPVSGLVRGKLIIAGYILEPIQIDGNNNVMTKVTYVVKTDIGGSVPGWVIKMKSKEQPMQLLTLLTMLDEEADTYSGGREEYIRAHKKVPKE